jgi:isopenicillin-N synthase
MQVEFNGEYLDIPGSKDPILVNIGGFFELLTKGYYKSPIHRVKWFNVERLSLPFFVNLSYNTKLKPFSPNEEEYAYDEPLSYGEYLENGLVNLVRKNGQT